MVLDDLYDLLIFNPISPYGSHQEESYRYLLGKLQRRKRKGFFVFFFPSSISEKLLRRPIKLLLMSFQKKNSRQTYWCCLYCRCMPLLTFIEFEFESDLIDRIEWRWWPWMMIRKLYIFFLIQLYDDVGIPNMTNDCKIIYTHKNFHRWGKR